MTRLLVGKGRKVMPSRSPRFATSRPSSTRWMILKTA